MTYITNISENKFIIYLSSYVISDILKWVHSTRDIYTFNIELIDTPDLYYKHLKELMEIHRYSSPDRLVRSAIFERLTCRVS